MGVPGKPLHLDIVTARLTTMQIIGPTQALSSSGLGQTPRKKMKASTREQQFMSVLSLEVFGTPVLE
jgi:hypothetical protein